MTNHEHLREQIKEADKAMLILSRIDQSELFHSEVRMIEGARQKVRELCRLIENRIYKESLAASQEKTPA